MKSIKPQNNLRKRFIAVSSDSLTIETIETLEKQGQSPAGTVPVSQLRILELKGTWRANEYNQLVFEAFYRKGPPETYTFKGRWRLNDNQQIEYKFGDGPDTLIFKGHWDISSASRLVYIFEGSTTSRFEFKAQLESASMRPKKGVIRYRIGAGIRQNRLTKDGQILILYGEWKFTSHLGLNFQMDYGQGKARSIEFGAEAGFGRNKVALALKDRLGEPLGATLTLTRKFLQSFDAEAFIRLKARKGRQGIEAGISIPF